MTPQEIAIAECRTQGATLQEIASNNGFHESTACRKLQKPEVKAYLEKLQASIINKALPRAVANIHHAINKYMDKASKDDPQLREHGFKASQRVMESVGLLSSHAPSLIFNQTFVDNHQEAHIHLEQAAKTALDHLGIVDIDTNDHNDKV